MRRETRFTAIQPATWKRVYERDNGRCVLCGRGGVLQGAHFIGRAQGGLGIEQIMVMLCPDCHREYDHGGGRSEKEDELREHLRECYPGWDESKLVYKKGME